MRPDKRQITSCGHSAAEEEELMDKILRIDVGAEGGPEATAVPVGEYAGLGGRALTSAIVSKEVQPSCWSIADPYEGKIGLTIEDLNA